MESSFSIVSTAILLLFILDPFGNIPILLSVLKNVDKQKHLKIIAREMLIGLFILVVFLFFGEAFLDLFGLETQAVTIAGGIIFFIIAIRMIFPDPHGHSLFVSKNDDEPMVVPIAIPMVSGPASIATLMLLSKSYPNDTASIFISVLLAWIVTSIILLSAPKLFKLLRRKGLTALERLMGMLLLMMAVEMFIRGIRELIPTF